MSAKGYVTVKSAAELYGVVLDPETFAVDVAATEKLRATRAAAGDAPANRGKIGVSISAPLSFPRGHPATPAVAQDPDRGDP